MWDEDLNSLHFPLIFPEFDVQGCHVVQLLSGRLKLY